MHRRAFLTGSAALLATPCVGEAQQAGKVYRIGFLLSGGPAPTPIGPNPGLLEFDAFIHQMRELGYVLGQNLTVETRAADGKFDRLPGLVAELIALKSDVIFAPATPAAQAAKSATSTIPIVIAVAPNPVEDGLVASLARPGGNVTGLTSTSLELSGKRLQLLKEIVPRVTRVAVLGNPDAPVSHAQMRVTQSAARSLGLTALPFWSRTPAEFDAALSAAKEGTGALVVLPDAMFRSRAGRLAEAAVQYRLPTVFEFKLFADAGGLMSYGADVLDLYRRAAVSIDRILKGAKPADLPVEQPTKFELVINLKTAKTLGLTIPQSLVLRADQVIE